MTATTNGLRPGSVETVFLGKISATECGHGTTARDYSRTIFPKDRSRTEKRRLQ